MVRDQYFLETGKSPDDKWLLRAGIIANKTKIEKALRAKRPITTLELTDEREENDDTADITPVQQHVYQPA